jgi:hypothetical protein
MTDDTEDKSFKWGDIVVSPQDVPTVSLFALAQRGFTHVLGNEVASALTAWRKTEEGVKADDAAITAWTNEKRKAKLEQILAGTLGVRQPGAPKATGIEAIMHAIAVENLRAKLAKFKLKLPTGDKTINVAGKDMDRDALIAAELRAGKMPDKVTSIADEAKRRSEAHEASVASADELFA